MHGILLASFIPFGILLLIGEPSLDVTEVGLGLLRNIVDHLFHLALLVFGVVLEAHEVTWLLGEGHVSQMVEFFIRGLKHPCGEIVEYRLVIPYHVSEKGQDLVSRLG